MESVLGVWVGTIVYNLFWKGGGVLEIKKGLIDWIQDKDYKIYGFLCHALIFLFLGWVCFVFGGIKIWDTFWELWKSFLFYYPEKGIVFGFISGVVHVVRQPSGGGIISWALIIYYGFTTVGDTVMIGLDLYRMVKDEWNKKVQSERDQEWQDAVTKAFPDDNSVLEKVKKYVNEQRQS